MSSDRSGRGLRRSIDDSAEEIGESVASELPVSGDEIRRQLPTDPDTGGGDGPLRAAIAESPLSDFLE